jgi:hypothetical protein
MVTPRAKSRRLRDKYLRDAFELERDLLQAQLELSRRSIAHSGVQGEVSEDRFRDLLRRYLPQRYAVDTAVVIDSDGKTSDQIDVVVYDNQYTPTLLDQEKHIFVPAEAVYAVFEVKPTIDKTYLNYAAGKAASVRRLKRTSVEMVSSGVTVARRSLFTIVSGIVAAEVSWSQGFSSQAFLRAVMGLKKNRFVDTGLAVVGGTFDFYDGTLRARNSKNDLAYFLFRLLQKLQSMGTVAAVDWTAYGRTFSR